MKILIASPLVHPENHHSSRFTSDLYSELKKKHEVKLVAFGKKPINRDPDCLFISKRRWLPIRALIFFWAVLKNARSVDYFISTHALIAALPTLIVAKIFNKPLVVIFSSDEVYQRHTHKSQTGARMTQEDFYAKRIPQKSERALFTVQRFTLGAADKVIVPSKQSKVVFSGIYGLESEKVKVIHPYLEKILWSPFTYSKNSFVFSILSSFTPHDTSIILTLFSVCTDLKRRFPSLMIHIFGDGEGREFLSKKAAECGLSSFVIFHGEVAKVTFIHYKRVSSIFLIPNLDTENISHIVENFYLKCITVTRDSPLAREFLTNDKNGLLFDFLNVQSVRKKIIELLLNRSKMKEMCNNAFDASQIHYSLERYVSSLIYYLQK